MSFFFLIVVSFHDVDYGAPDDEFLDVLCFLLPLGQDRAKDSELRFVAASSSPSTTSRPWVSWVMHLPLPSFPWHVGARRSHLIHVFPALAVLRRSLNLVVQCCSTVECLRVPALGSPRPAPVALSRTRSHLARTLQASRSSGEFLCRSPRTPWPRVKQLLELERPCFPS